MKGTYGYLQYKREWYWKIEVDGVEVASGLCKHKSMLNAVIRKHSMVRWTEDRDMDY